MTPNAEIRPETPVGSIRGIGEARAAALRKAGIENAADLIAFYPSGYEERGNIRKLCDVGDGETGACAVVVRIDTEPKRGRGKSGIEYVRVCASDNTGSVTVTFFNNKWITQSLSVGRIFRLYGRIEPGRFGLECVNPVLESYSADLPPVVPVYPAIPDVPRSVLIRAIEQVLPLADSLPEALSAETRTQFALPTHADAVRMIHFPAAADDAKQAVRRLAFEELTVFQLALCKLRTGQVVKKARAFSQKDTGVRRFFESLPFELTGAQKRAVKEIYADMETAVPMMRLVQGDVGSGKTVLAAAAAYLAVKNGAQAAVMAPTEILAAQHYATLTKMLSPFGIKTVLLTGSVSASQKKALRQEIADGTADVVVGTNAVIQGGVEFARLGLAVTDEQHRFGVLQRANLIEKGDTDACPHTLVMSATPIPRTLSLILYGDLDISILDELPPGRQQTETRAVPAYDRDRVNAFLRREISKGRQVFVVCPLVAESEALDALSAEEKYEAICKALPEFRAELLHGRMKGKDKTAVMARFKAGETDILVSTTVVEVGVDVPNATVMVIENAERFGLSTLHQLRGRIGRGSEKSYCILIYDRQSEKSKERLDTMCRTSDGFEIARADLKLRGPGDFFGERQSGEVRFRVASIADTELIAQTRAFVDTIIDGNLLSLPEYACLNDESEKLYKTNLNRNIFN